MFGSRPFGRRVQHGILTPPEFAKLMREMAFVIGAGAPPDGPSALEALANGAAFLNPIVRYSRHPHRTASWRSCLPCAYTLPCGGELPASPIHPHAHTIPSLKPAVRHTLCARAHVALD